MGATNFDHVVSGYNVREVFDDLVEDAIFENGNDSYNGTISTCSLGRCKLQFEKYSESNLKKAYKFVESNDWGEKWTANYIDLGVKEYHVLTIKKRNVGKENPVYKMKFVVKPSHSNSDDYPTHRSFSTKTEADQYAMEQTLKKDISHSVTKEYVLEKGDSVLTETYIEKKVYKSKPNLKPMANRKIVPVHVYLFYGWASC